MLLHQAGFGFAAWFGVAPTVDEDLRRFVAGDLMTEPSPPR
jgi:shikimate dehydrogenase